MSETHIPGAAVTLNGRYMRQRCEWCGKTLLDYDLSLVAVEVRPGEEPRGPGQYPVGELLRIDGNASYPVSPDELTRDADNNVIMPDDACTRWTRR